MNDMLTSPLVLTLRLAVPLWIAVAADQDEHCRAGLLERWRTDGLDVVAHGGDDILYRGAKWGDSAKSFNALARAMAAMAHAYGGVTAFGLTWCVEHSPAGTDCDGPTCAHCYRRELLARAAGAMTRLALRRALSQSAVVDGDVSDQIIGEGGEG